MRRVAPVFLIAASLAVGAPVAASTFVAMSLAELIAGSDAIIQGHVERLQSFWSASGRLIVTDATVEVEEALVGTAGQTVRVRIAGGTVGGFTVDAHGFPKFEQGERVILFLTGEDASGARHVVGHQLGHYQIVTRLDGVTLAVPMVDDGMRLLDASGGPAREPRSVPIEEFHSRIVPRLDSR